MGPENAGQVHTAPYGGAYEAPIVSTEAATPLHTPRIEGRMDPPRLFSLIFLSLSLALCIAIYI